MSDYSIRLRIEGKFLYSPDEKWLMRTTNIIEDFIAGRFKKREAIPVKYRNSLLEIV